MKKDREKFKTEFKQRLYGWVLDMIRLTDKLPKDGASSVIKKQLIRSGSSIGANYIEAQAASSKKDFTNFIHHSLKSANESKFWLALLRDSKRASKEDILPLLNELEELSNILGASLLKLKGKR